jgi:altronate dehydratase
MSFKSWLDKVGEDVEKDFEAALPWLQKAGGIVTVFDPSLGALFNTTVNIVATVEQKWAALGKQTGTGTQKLADAVQIGEPVIAQGLKLAGQDSSTAGVTNYINSVVAVLNGIPAPKAA